MRPLELQAWVVKGTIPRKVRSKLGGNSASRMSNSISRDGERICKRTQEIVLQRFTFDFGVEEPDSALNTQAKFHKDHGRGWERIWYCGNAIRPRKIGGEIPDLAGRHSKQSAIAVGKEFGMAESNFFTKNARSEVKEFATKI